LLDRRSARGSRWLTLLALMVTKPAAGSGFSVARFAGEQGHPTTDNPTALYFNPAALRARRTELMLDGLCGIRRLSYTRPRRPSDAVDPPGADGANVGRARLSNFIASPSLWLAVPLGSRWVLAAGVFTPFGGPLRWSERPSFAASRYPGPLDGVTRFHAIEGLSVTSYASLGAAYALTESWRLGLALNGIYTRVEDVRAWSGGGNDVVGEGRSLLEVDGVSWGLGAGLFYAARGLSFGLSYQSRPNLAAGMKLSGRLANDIGGPSSASVELHQDLPDIVRLGTAYRARPNVELRLFAAWERWSAFDRQCVTQKGARCALDARGGQEDGGAVLQNIPRNFQDAFEARAGISIWVSPTLEFLSGAGVMSSAAPSSTLDASLPDFFGVTFSLGARVQLSDVLGLGASLSQILSPARTANSRLQDYALPSKLPDASGHYAQSLSYADLNVSVRF
jgi:long-chain fatty acid transport protein